MKLNRYQKTAYITVFATVFLIFIGSLVRASGSGLGCPDWPKCFGTWIPPLSVDALPEGFDPSQFNVIKTWTEYINRLIGVIIGFLITATAVFSFKYWKSKKSVTIASIASFILVLFQAWLGGQVVATELSEVLITLHMLLAMIILLLLLFAAFKSTEDQYSYQISKKDKRVLQITSTLLILFTLAQILLGTQVREAIDAVSNHLAEGNGKQWLEDIGNIDEIHRSFSWTIFLSSVFSLYYSFKNKLNDKVKRFSLLTFSCVIIQILIGITLQYYGMPRSFQVMHLTFASILICLCAIQAFSLINAKVD